MLKRTLLCLISLLVLTAFTSGSERNADDKDVFIVGHSQQRFQKLFHQGMESGYFYYEELTKNLLPYFQGLPYGAGGVGCPSDKTLVNFFSYDCVTLVETYWALAYTIFEFHAGHVRRDARPFSVFTKNLNRIRYFGGENCGIDYRIHYFTQQMEELDRSGLAFNVGIANGVPFRKHINYISQHSEDFGDFAESSRHKSLESIFNKTPKYYYPMRKRALYYPLAKDGDIISFSSVEPGLDVSHCGIITIKDGKVKLNHASGLYEKVVLDQDLERYLRGRTKVNGFFVYRPRFESRRARS